MPLNQTQLRNQIWSATGTDSDDISGDELDTYLNLSWWEIQDKLGFREKEGTADFSTAAGTQAYDVSSISSDLESIQHVAIQNTGMTTWEPLHYKDYRYIVDNNDDSVDSRDLPEYYSRYNEYLYLLPIPSGIFTVRVTYLKTLDDLISSGYPVPQSWHEIIRLGAEARVWHSLGEPTRRNEAFAFRDSLATTATEVKVKENVSKQAAISLLRAPYP